MNFHEIILAGGIGPGAYYPWLYLQAWFCLPLIVYLTDKLSPVKSFLLFLFICIILQLVSCLTDINTYFYRLAFYRYLFLLYLGCYIQKYKTKLSLKIYILATVSAIFILICNYSGIDMRPFFFNQWQGYSWPGYFYTVFFFLILKEIYKKYAHRRIVRWITDLGSMSYEIFLCQMFFFSFIGYNTFRFIPNSIIQYLAFIVTTTILSIAPIIIYKIYLKPKFTHQ